MPAHIANARVQIQARIPPHALVVHAPALQRRHAHLAMPAERDLHARAPKGGVAVGALDLGSGLLRLVLRHLVEAWERWRLQSCGCACRGNASGLFDACEMAARDDGGLAAIRSGEAGRGEEEEEEGGEQGAHGELLDDGPQTLLLMRKNIGVIFTG